MAAAALAYCKATYERESEHELIVRQDVLKLVKRVIAVQPFMGSLAVKVLKSAFLSVNVSGCNEWW